MILTRDKGFYKNFNSLYWVLILHNIITLSVNLADNVMVGSYSEASLSGVAAVNQIQYIYQLIIMSAGDSVVVLCSQYWGQQRTAEIRKIISGALYLGAFAGLLLFLLTSFFPGQIVGLFTESPEIIEQGVEYLRLIRFTYILFALTNLLLAGMRSVKTVRIGFRVSLVTLVVNCSINYVLINGHFGAPALGVTGAAIGTLTARAVELIIVLIYVLRFDKKLSAKVKDFVRPDATLTRDYLKICWRFVLVGAMFGVSTALQTVILGHMSDSAIAANSVASAIFQVLKVASVGAASATAVIIGETIGKSETYESCRAKLREYVRTLQVMYIGIGIAASLILFFVRIPVLSLYSSLSSESRSLANSFILVLCVTGMGTAYQMPVITGIIRGGGDSTFVLINDLISIWGIVLPLSFLGAFVFGWSPIAVIFCLNSDQIFKCAAAAVKANRYRWIRKLTRG